MAKENNSRKDNRGRRLKDGERLRSDGRYEFRYIDPVTGKRVGLYDKDLSALRQKERELQRKIDDGLLTAGELRNSTLNAMHELHMQIIQIEDTTRGNYQALWKNHVQDSLGMMKIKDIRPTHIKMFYGEMTTKGYAWGTLKVIHGMIIPAFALAIDESIIYRNPAQHQLNGFGEKPKARDALTVDQQKRLFEFVKKSPCYKKHLPMLQIMVGTALRVGELTGLTWSDFDRPAKELNIDHQLIYKNRGEGCKFYVVDHTKTDAGTRTIPLTSAVCAAFAKQREYQFMLGIDHDIEVDGYRNFVFTAKSGMPLAPNAVNNVLYNIVKAYNKQEETQAKKEKRKPELLPKISAHIMRHTGCTRMAESGMDPKILQYLMGHSECSITMNVYNHVSSLERVKKEVERIENEELAISM
ncbi:MAG: site-specific integrase [Lachnospiraceae bacterium]|nr:site-specific integrase [Lachnospiraceae bacterium]